MKDAAVWPDARLLIVDDQAVNIQVLERLLANEGYTHVRSTTKGAEVVALCDEMQPDLLLLDLRMPGIDGYAVLEQLGRSLPPETYLPVLVLTADDTEEAKRRALALGAHDLLTKPFDHLEVGLRIRNLLHTRRLHVQLYEHNVRLQEKVRAQIRALKAQMTTVEQAHAEARAILDVTSDAMLLVGEDGRVRSTNRQFGAFFGLDPEDVERWGGEVSGHIRRTLVDPETFLLQLRHWMADPEGRFQADVVQQWPTERTLAVASAPVSGVGRLMTFRDVTKERAVDRMKSEFVALVSHELRTPLTSISGYLDLVLAGEVGDLTDDQREFLGIVRSNAGRLGALISQLLDISRIESGAVAGVRRPVDLVEIVQTVARSLRPQIERKRQELTLTLDTTRLLVLADQDQLIQVVTNLLQNASKYTAPGGRLTCGTGGAGDQVRLAIGDTGIGMSSDEQTHVFERFYRASERPTQEVGATGESGGTGLGLAITKALVELHGGTITVASMPGEGSTFTVTLPRMTDEAAEEPPAPAPLNATSTPPVAVHRMVLVVEADLQIAQLLQRFLKRGGYQVVVAHSGAEGLRLAQCQSPDLITLDIGLPDTDGFAVLDQLQRSVATAAIPVLIISSMPDDGRGDRLGAAGYYTKPVVEDLLLQQVGKILV